MEIRRGRYLVSFEHATPLVPDNGDRLERAAARPRPVFKAAGTG